MDFSISAETQDRLDQVKEFLEKEIYPLEEPLQKQSFTSLLPEIEKKRQMVRDLGLWTPQISKEHGGSGLKFQDHAMLTEILGRTPLGHYTFNCQAPDAGNMEILCEFGTDEQKEKYLKPLVAGTSRSFFGMTEPEHAGSNPVWMSTTAVRDGDEYVINGHKWFSSGADGAAFAVVMAVTNPDEEPHKRASQILVPTDTPGYEFVRNIPVMGHSGDDWLSHSEVRFNDVRVPVSNLLGEEGTGFKIAQARLGPGRIHHCMRWIGICERSHDLMCQYALKRELAPGDPLANRQTIQNWIAECRAHINASRLMVLQAAWKIDNVGAREAREEISVIKFYVAGVMMDVIDKAVQVHGGLGVSDDTILSYFYRFERGARIYDGPDEVHKTVVARQALKKFR
jgi:acyl-CoA dehydrogenase